VDSTPSDLIDRAKAFATKAHAGQVRKYTGTPYIEHPERVAARVARLPYATPEMVAAAWLHDVAEDCTVTFKMLIDYFGPAVAALVWDLTDQYTKEEWPDLNRAARKRREAARLACVSREAKAIKLADVADNLSSLDPADDFAPVFVREKVALLAAIGGADETLRAEVEEAAKRFEVRS